MKKIALSAIAALALAVVVYQVALRIIGNMEVAALIVAAIAGVAAAFAAGAHAFAIAAIAAIAFVVAVAFAFVAFAFAAVAFVVAILSAIVVANEECIPEKWAMAIYGVFALMTFSAFTMFNPTISLASVLAGSVAILGVWRLYALRQIKAVTA